MEKRGGRKHEEVEALLTAARAVLRHRSFDEAARIIFKQAKETTGASAGYVALLSEDGSENELLFLDSGGQECSVDPSLPMPIRGLRELAYRENHSVYHNDFMNSQWAELMPKGHLNLQNVLFAPLVIEARTVGVIGLANKAEDFNGEDARVVGALGEFAAMALQNSRTLDELSRTVDELNKALLEVRTLRGIIPICSKCKKIRDDHGYWQQLEEYISHHSEADFTHGLCPKCYRETVQE